jgi:hypothetical protein
MFLFPLATLFIIAFAIFLSASFYNKSRIAFFLALFLFAYTNIILATEIASLFRLIKPGFLLSIQLILASAAGIVWLLTGKPPLLGPFRGKNRSWKGFFDFGHHPEVVLLGACLLLAYGIGVYLILATPQNNYDSMTYHLSRVGYWLQHGALTPWPTPNPRQTTFPPNAEIGLLWTVLFWGSDQISGFVQWMCVPVIIVTIYGLARLLGAKPWQSLLVALIWASLPEVVLQSITTMNDLVSAAFFASAVYFLYAGWYTNTINYLLLSGLAIGLAVGTKSTVILALPGLMIVFLLLIIYKRKDLRKKLVVWIAAGCVSFLLVGSLSYIQNYAYYRNPFSISQWTNDFINPDFSRSELVTRNLFLYSVQMVDMTGLPVAIRASLGEIRSELAIQLAKELPLTMESGKVRLLTQLHRIINAPQQIHEDLAWFGPLFLILVIPMVIYQVIVGVRRKDSVRLGLVGILLSFALVLSYMQDWTPYRGRYFVLVSPFAMPLLTPWFGYYRGSAILRWGIPLISILVLGQTILFNESKPLIGTGSIWGKDNLNMRVINFPSLKPVLQAVEEYVPIDDKLGTRMSLNTWDYPLFGKDFSRGIFQLDPMAKEIDFQELIYQGIEFFLIQPRERTFLKIPPGIEIIWENDGWLLLHACVTGECLSNPQEMESITATHDSQNLASVSPVLVGKVGILELVPGEWPIEQYDGRGLYWLGEGLNQGLKGYLWSDDDREATLSVELEPGPSRTDTVRTLRIDTSWLNGYEFVPEGNLSETRTFHTPQTINFKIKLQRGLNEFRLQASNIATIPVQPNGDQRPLLIKVMNILVQP